ncbi:hypothetical protein T01_4328 [Trichinella spiralis]|uniref:Uncharacterized protein n=1 Tax=Trichinella spiralis TaxID=6334 RepID=A0A0V1BML3_TRISP|nr:hypothetical protein T01_4328 [Trichinella spiralis]
MNSLCNAVERHAHTLCGVPLKLFNRELFIERVNRMQILRWIFLFLLCPNTMWYLDMRFLI